MFLVHTDFGHDPDDAIALAYLIENGCIPDEIRITPGFDKQSKVVGSFITLYDLKKTFFTLCSGRPNKIKEANYNPGKHSLLFNGKYNCPYQHNTFNDYTVADRVLIIGPAKGLGDKLECNEMFFQGGYSPNSIKPLEKFRGVESIQSFNPNGAIEDFLLLLNSTKIKKKYYVGKNVCHGFTKRDLIKIWQPKNPTVCKFFDELQDDKAMHDVLAAILFMNKDLGIWSQEKPVRIAGKYTTEPTNEEIYSLIGLNL